MIKSFLAVAIRGTLLRLSAQCYYKTLLRLMLRYGLYTTLSIFIVHQQIYNILCIGSLAHSVCNQTWAKYILKSISNTNKIK